VNTAPYTTQLSAGLGLVDETKCLLELWQPGMASHELLSTALVSGQFPNLTARRLRNIVVECFAPRYLPDQGEPATLIKPLATFLPTRTLCQFLLIFTCRANPILHDFVRQVYWPRYASGYAEITTDDGRAFIERAIDDGKICKPWSESTIQKASSHLTGCCADYGMLEPGSRSTRRFLPFRIAPTTVACLAHDLHFAGLGDNALLSHEDWQLFGMAREDVLEELKRVSRQGWFIVQAAGDVVRIGWKHHDREALCDVLAQG
jgi:hypothetical protein